jgi:hypothetical protein
VTYSTADVFSVTALNDPISGPGLQETLKNLIGDEKYEEWFKMKRTITLKDAVNQNPDTLAKLVAAIQKAGLDLAEMFTVTDALVHCDDLDRKQYELDDQTLTEFRALCPPRAAAIKPVKKEA